MSSFYKPDDEVRVAILIPCFNEERTILKVVNDFREVLPKATIYVFDNNSSDRTVEMARQGGALVRFEKKQGKGNVVRTMFRDIDADCYVLVDGDDTYPANVAPKLVNFVVNENIDMVVGDRLSTTYFTENKRAGHNFGNLLVRYLINLFWRSNGTKIADVMSGYRAFSYRFVKSFPVISEGFEIETEMSIHALDKNLKICSVPILYRDRPQGSVSKLNTISDGIKVLMMIFNLFREYKPFQFFSVFCTLFFLLLSGVLFLPVFIDYLQTGLVDKLPTFIASLIFFLVSLLSFVCGLILDSLAKNAKRNFELFFNLLNK